MAHSNLLARLRPGALLLAVALLASPILAGCLAASDDVVKGVKTRCDGNVTPLVGLPPTGSVEKKSPTGAVVPPFQGTVRVALLVPAGGDPDSVAGAELAASEMRQAGGPIEITVVPVAATGAAAGLGVFRNLTERDPPSLVLSALDADTTEGMIDEAHVRRVPVVATAASADRLVSDHGGSGFFFRMAPSDAVEGRALAELVWAQGCRTANVIVGPGERADDVRVAFRAAFEGKGGAVAAVVHGSSAKDAVAKAEFLGKAGEDEPRPDAIVVIASPEGSAALLREAYRTKVSARSVLFFSESSKTDAFVAAGGKDDNGHVLAANLRGTASMRADTPATEAFLNAFKGATGGREATNLSMRAYDAVYLAMLSASCARSPEPRLVAAKLATVANRDTGDTDVSGADPALALTVASHCLVNYMGAGHDFDWNGRGETVTGRFHVWTVSTDGLLRIPVTRYEPPAQR